MTNFSVEDRTIFFARHGSHAYGLNIATSDEDYKGICIKPKSFYLGFKGSFEQQEKMASKNDGVDSVVYSLDKFARLAAECNPNIIEVLFVDESDILKIDSFGKQIRDIRKLFLSKKIKHTFSGYAYSQLKRIKLHRSWLFNPIKKKPERKDFGLPEHLSISTSELGVLDSIQHKGETILSESVFLLYSKEKQYQTALLQYNQYNDWLKNRNKARSKLESEFGFDTKHGMHLIRLMKMCKEILLTGEVNVKRTIDREELLAIRNGKYSYDEIVQMAESLEKDVIEAANISHLPNLPDYDVLNDFIISLTDEYLKKNG
jgi:predicted nucleotidyltransferase